MKKKTKRENSFQPEVIKDLQALFPECIILKNDPNYIQGIPDLTVLYRNKWALLECKRDSMSTKQSNQDYYVNKANKMSFARIIFPENKEEVLHDLQQAFRN